MKTATPSLIVTENGVQAEAGLVAAAIKLAQILRGGDVLALHGDLGAGKTTFARAVIRALVGDPAAEVPSPTFAIEQMYQSAGYPGFEIAHYDLYRLAGVDDLVEIGFFDRLGVALVMIEWPERAGAELPQARADVTLTAAATLDQRHVRITVPSAWQART